jgi:hypothetical protein
MPLCSSTTWSGIIRCAPILDARNIWSTYGLRKQGFTYMGIGVEG